MDRTIRRAVFWIGVTYVLACLTAVWIVHAIGADPRVLFIGIPLILVGGVTTSFEIR